MGVIYIIQGPTKKYIGQHNTDNAQTRMNTHIAGFRAYMAKLSEIKELDEDDPNKNQKLKGCIALYRAFQKHGVENFTCQVLHNDVDPADIDDLEDKCIIEHGTMAPNGYNLRLNKGRGQFKTLSAESKERFSQAATARNEKYIDKYRRYKVEMKDMPRYVTFYQDKEGYRGYKIDKHPQCRTKSFTSKTIPLETLKLNCIEFLNSLEDSRYEKPERTLPTGICKPKDIPHGYIAYFKKDGQRHSKCFRRLSDEENLQQAIEWLDLKKSEIQNAGRVREPPTDSESDSDRE